MDYRKLFVITRELQKKRVPDDLMQLIFEYVGDMDETIDELQNKHVFYRIENLITGKTYAHYCSCCDQTLCYKTNKGLARHCQSIYHQKKKQLPIQKVTKSTVIDDFKLYFTWSSFYRALDKKLLKVVRIKYKKPRYYHLRYVWLAKIFEQIV